MSDLNIQPNTQSGLQASGLENKNSGSRLLYIVLALLLAAALTTAVLMSSPFAKFFNSEGDSDGARIARYAFGKKVVSSNLDYTLTSTSKNGEFQLSVNNQNTAVTPSVNETKTKYDVILTLPKKTADGTETRDMLGVTPTLTNESESTTISSTKSSDGYTYTFANAGTLAAGVAEADLLTLKFTLDTSVYPDNGTWGGESAADTIKVQVVATQVD